MASLFGSLARGIGGVAGSVLRSPIGRAAISATGPIGAGIAVGSTLLPLFAGGSKGLPALPGLPGASAATMGQRGIFQNDPNIAKMLQAYAISKSNLRTYFRAPKGFVVLKDEKGDSYGLPKFLARKMGMWKPAKKPLLSISDTNAIRQAGSAIKKLQKAEKQAMRIANWRAPKSRTNIIIQKKGK